MIVPPIDIPITHAISSVRRSRPRRVPSVDDLRFFESDTRRAVVYVGLEEAAAAAQRVARRLGSVETKVRTNGEFGRALGEALSAVHRLVAAD